MAGTACGDGAERALGGDAADRHSRHGLALAARHRAPPVGAPVAPGPVGRPATYRNVRSAVLRLAREKESWGYRRIHGELAGLGIKVAPSTVWQILKSARDQPGTAPGRPWLGGVPAVPGAGILALDFFTADLLNGTKVYVLAVIEHGTRRIRILGATEHRVQAWVVQQARNLLNSIMERCIGSCRRELLDRTLVWNRRHLMMVLREYEDFSNTHRPHRALSQAALLRALPDGEELASARIRRHQVLGGLIHEYQRAA
jgi:putative transposase